MAAIDEIHSVAIHPAIGIARVGSSRSFYIGPEVPGAPPPETLRGGDGGILRQAARFRLFARNAAGEVVAEIGAADAAITWTVHLANRKAEWYQFIEAFDVPSSRGERLGIPPLESPLRNAAVAAGDRDALVIDPGPRTLGTAGPHSAAFDGGTFRGEPVDLGAARVEDDGSLVVLGGFGRSASPSGAPIVDFANNDDWYDDTADGPVDAVVVLPDGRSIEAVGSWLVVGPPNFAPGLTPLVTGWEVLLDRAARADPTLAPQRPAFGRHIRPILQRLSEMQWVNSGYALRNGWGSPSDTFDHALLERLADPGPAARPLRETIFARFRDPTYTEFQPEREPRILGDTVLFDPVRRDPQEWLALTPLQMAWLRRWAAGDFEPDSSAPPAPTAPAEHARALDQAALEDTAGGPFHPGIEFTWPMRQPMLYDPGEPFRVRRRTLPVPPVAAVLTAQTALAPGGPLDGSRSGDLTRWMALPWQTDTASCLSAYEATTDEYLPTFWPARVPNDVITEAAYNTIMDPAASADERFAAFSIARRRKLLRGYTYQDTDTPHPRPNGGVPESFVHDWPQIGTVERRDGPADIEGFPTALFVEVGRRAPAPTGGAAAGLPMSGAGRSAADGAARPPLPGPFRRGLPPRSG